MNDKNIELYLPKVTDPDDDWKTFIKQLINQEANAILKQVESNPLLMNVKAPEEIMEKLWMQIRNEE